MPISCMYVRGLSVNRGEGIIMIRARERFYGKQELDKILLDLRGHVISVTLSV
jgi:hypothetical protein